MSTTVAPAGPATPAGSADPLKERRPLGDRVFQILALASGLLVLVILVWIAVSTSQQASSWFSTEGWKIFTNNWNPAANDFGALAFIYGTAVTAVIAIIMAVPVSVGIALLLTEVVPYRWSRPIVYVIDLLAVVPSVVWGLWGILVSYRGFSTSTPRSARASMASRCSAPCSGRPPPGPRSSPPGSSWPS